MPTTPTSRHRAVVVVVTILVLARVVAVVVLLGSGIEEEFTILGGDARRYEAIVTAEGTPYLDTEVEYPPVAVGWMALVVRPTTLGTLTTLAVSQLVLELATAGILAWAWSRRTAVTYLVLGTPMIFFAFPYVRIDLLSVFLAVGGLALLRRRRQVSGGVLLAVSVFAKLWPLVVAPSMLLRRQWRGLTAWAITGAAGLAGWVLWAGTDGIGQILSFRGATGWQIESLPGVVLHALEPSASTVQQGAWRTAVDATPLARNGLTLLGLVLVAVSWRWAGRAHHRRLAAGDPRGAELVLDGLGPLAAVLAMLVCSTIVSPQYVVWFLPFAAIVTAAGDRLVGVLTLVTTTLSTLGLYWIHGLVDGDWGPVTVIVGRNAALVALLVVSLGRLARLARPGTPTPVAVDGAAADPPRGDDTPPSITASGSPHRPMEGPR